MEVKCLSDVYGYGEVLFKSGCTYPTSVYKGILSAQTEKKQPYPIGYEAIAFDSNENWNRDKWFSYYFEIVNE
ncbi:hypothetical protein [Brevibacillus sp. NRS-1366]|uniref:hypothetical protein n=1 Tax=Brevibacillus sp. NRS-1366 TaxID=3233899 RepID=UPI003D20608A